jgi:hypothetical protein
LQKQQIINVIPQPNFFWKIPFHGISSCDWKRQ